MLTDSLGYVLSQGSAFLLDADDPSSFDFPANYVVLNFAAPPPIAASAALFRTVGRIDPELFETDTSGYTQFGRAYLSLQSAVPDAQFIAGYVAAAARFGVEYTPIVNGKPSLFQGGAAFPGNDWVVSPHGEEYLAAYSPAESSRAAAASGRSTFARRSKFFDGSSTSTSGRPMRWYRSTARLAPGEDPIQVTRGDRQMKSMTVLVGAATLAIGFAAGALLAQPPQQGPQPFSVGNRLGLPVTPAADGAFDAISSNVKVYGAIYSAESCSYDPGRGVIVVPNRGVPQNVQTNNAWVSFINHDGSVNTARWLGIQNPADRASLTPPLVLNEPYGSDIANNMLYVADRDGGTTPTDTSVAVVRRFNLQTGAPAGEMRVEKSTWFNDIEVADDGTVYATQTGVGGEKPDASTWQVWKITPDGSASIFVQGAPLRQPNGIAFDPQGNIVVVNIGNTEVLTFSRDGKLVKTENAAQAGNDGLVIMPDGTKYVSSVVNGGVSRIRPGQPAELIARNIPSAASMCYDAGANQLVIPMNANNALAFIPLK